MGSWRVFLMLAGLAPVANGNSLGLNVPLCDIDDPSIWKSKNAGGKYMYWCDPPKHTDDFSVRAGDGERSQDLASYVPEGLVYIHVRALKQDLKFRGLLLYAQDDAGNKVGSWELPEEEEKMFHTPQGSCGGRAIFHSGADPKNFHNVFAFRAPAKGTGKITFKCLLKSGAANTGAFHWPNKDGPLTLTESPKKLRLTWLEATGGSQSCDDVCKGAGKACNANLLQAIKSEAKFMGSVGKEHVCKRPILSDCSGAAPYETSAKFCAYTGSGCAATTCAATVKGKGKRFCPCMGSSNLLEDTKDSWEEADEWTEVADVGKSNSKHGCSQFYTRDSCEESGCAFQEQEGMVICTEQN